MPYASPLDKGGAGGNAFSAFNNGEFLPADSRHGKRGILRPFLGQLVLSRLPFNDSLDLFPKRQVIAGGKNRS